MLDTTQEKMFLDNRRLVYHIAKGLTSNVFEYEDYVSVGMIGLIKAVINFDSSRGVDFGACASKYISNEIRVYYRKNKNYLKNVSIYQSISNELEEDDSFLIDVLEDSNANFADKLIEKDNFLSIFNMLLNNLDEREKIIILYMLANLTTKEIAEKLDIGTRWITILEKKIAEKIKRIYNTQARCITKFVFEEENENEYKFSFLYLENSEKKEKFLAYIEEIASGKTEVEYYKNRITIKNIRLEPETFSLIGQIIQKKQKLKI